MSPSNTRIGAAKILICGCIASGKTTLAERIRDRYPEWDFVSIDAIRNAISDGTSAGEAAAQQSFADVIGKEHNTIVEFTGFGEEGDRVFQSLRDFAGPILLLLLRVPIEISSKRLQSRSETLIFPDYTDKLERMVYSVYFKFVSGILAARWAERPNICILQHDSINLENQQFLLDSATRFIQSLR